MRCPDHEFSLSQRLKMYYFNGKLNRGHMVCPLYRGCLYLGESLIKDFTVYLQYITNQTNCGIGTGVRE